MGMQRYWCLRKKGRLSEFLSISTFWDFDQLYAEQKRDREAALKEAAEARRAAQKAALTAHQPAASMKDEPFDAALVRLAEHFREYRFLNAGELLEELRARIASMSGSAAIKVLLS